MKKTIVFVFAFFLATALPVLANTVTWSQEWGMDTNPTSIEVFMISPSGALTHPGGVSSLPAGWTSNQPNPNYVDATNNGIGTAGNYFINFTTPVGNPVTMDVLEYNGSTLNEQIRFFYSSSNLTGYSNSFGTTGGTWYWDNSGVNVPDPGSYNRAATPEPSTWGMMLGGFGLAAIGFTRRRKHNKT